MYSFDMAIYISYKFKNRYAFRSTVSSSGTSEALELVKIISNKYGDVGIGIYSGTSKSEKYEDIMVLDSYYKDLIFIDDIDSFISIVESSEEIEALDIAALVASRLKCTHLKLQKMLYLTYCKYLKKYGDVLFLEEFQAWELGPVVASVYTKFKGKREDIELKAPQSEELRFFSSHKGRNVISIVEDTIKEFGHLSASELVDYTHEPGRAWQIVRDKNKKTITPYYIKKSKDFL